MSVYCLLNVCKCLFGYYMTAKKQNKGLKTIKNLVKFWKILKNLETILKKSWKIFDKSWKILDKSYPFFLEHFVT